MIKIEILECTPQELADLLTAMNKIEAVKLLIETAALIVATNDILKKEVGNLLTENFETEIFEADLVKDVIKDEVWNQLNPEPPESEPTDGDKADILAKYLKGE